MSRTSILWAAPIVLALVALAPLTGSTKAQVTFTLFFGWIEFVCTVLPEVHIRWDGVLLAGTAFALFLAVSHYLACWLYRELRASGAKDSVPRNWRFRWTLSLSAVLILLFAAGISLVGVTHQTIWLTTEKEPMYERVLVSHGRISNGNDIKQIGIAFHNGADSYDRGLPSDMRDEHGRALHSWETQLLPFLPILTEADLTLPWDDPANSAFFKKPVRLFLNPELRTTQLKDSDGFWFSHYAANVRVLGDGDCALDKLGDNTSNTILMGEVNDHFVPWGKPGNFRDPALGLNQSPDGFGGPRHSRGVTFLMADGSVRFIASDIEPDALERLSGPRQR